jgi:5-methylcytosine-specific restriction protein A
MPSKADRFCSHPGGCPNKVKHGRCPVHRLRERDRPNVDIRKEYRTPRWLAYRRQKFQEQPFCVECEKQGRYVQWFRGGVLDHIIPHRGNLDMFYDYNNLQGLCWSHHSAKTGRGQ